MEKRDYHTIRIRCRCRQCAKIPAWAFPGGIGIVIIHWIKTFSLYAALIVLSFLCYTMFDGERNLRTILPAMYVALPAVIYYAVGLIYMARQKMRLRQLDERYLPSIRLAMDKES